ncbi:hypothetical protein QQM79_11160 [Marinobacteraceae bacterium S3BR75-40.1]
MADLHIEDFYRDTALILEQLYNAFPRKTSVYVEDIAGADNPDEFGLHSPRHMACFGTMLWLAEEGFIRFQDTITQIAIDQAVLTQSTFVTLSALSQDPDLMVDTTEKDWPAPVKADQNTHINLIRRALKSGNTTRISVVMHRILFADQ